MQCNCPRKQCIRHGKCEECIKRHTIDDKRGPYCLRKRDKKAKAQASSGDSQQ